MSDMDDVTDTKKRRLEEGASVKDDGSVGSGDNDGSPGSYVPKKKKTKKKEKNKTKLGIDDEAEESDEDAQDVNERGSDDDEDGEDQNNYVADGFLIADGDQGSDDSDDDEDKPMKNVLNKLKRKKGAVILDEEDEQLIQDHINDELEKAGALATAAAAEQSEDNDDEIAPISGKGEDAEHDESNEIAPEKIRGKRSFYDNDDDDDGMDDFIVGEDGDEGGEDGERGEREERPPAPRREKGEKGKGPSFDQIQEAIDIFGEGFDDFDDEEEEEEGDGEDQAEEINEEETGEDKISKKDQKTINVLRSRYERSQLVAHFCTDKDDETRKVDIPERFLLQHTNMKDRPTPSDEDRLEEARWMTAKLTEKIVNEIKDKGERNGRNTYISGDEYFEMQKSFEGPVDDVLKFFLIDQLEVPFIWTYRKDYLHPLFTRDHLWYLLGLDSQWVSICLLKLRLTVEIQALSDAAQGSSSGTYGDEDERTGDDTLGEVVRKTQQQIRELTNAYKSLQVDVEEAEELEKRLMDILEEKDEDGTAEDRDKVRLATEALDDSRAKLNSTRVELGKKREEVQLTTQRIDRKARYDPNAAKEVLRLFPRERYEPMIESSVELADLKTISMFLGALVKGTEAGAVNAVKESRGDDDDDLDDSDDEGAKKSPEEAPTAALQRGRTGLTKKDDYSRYKTSPALRRFVEYAFVPACNLGDGMRHRFKVPPPDTPMQDRDTMAQEVLDTQRANPANRQILKSVQHVTKAAAVLISMEMSLEPNIRKIASSIYRQIATVSTRPTEKGLLAINPFSEYFGIQYLQKKPLADFFVGDDRSLFLRLVDAQKEGLITYAMEIPLKSVGNVGEENLVVDAAPFLQGEMQMLRYAMPDKDPKYEEFPQSRLTWDVLRIDVLQMCTEKYLIPSLEAEYTRDLVRIGKDYVVELTAKKFEMQLSVGPYRTLRQDAREATKELLRSCPDRPPPAPTVASIFTSQGNEAVFLAFVNQDGVLRSHDTIPFEASNQKKQKIKAFILANQPDLIVVNSSGGRIARSVLTLIEREIIKEVTDQLDSSERQRRELRNNQDSDDDEEEDGEYEPYKGQVMMIKDDIAKIFKVSPRASRMFPELQPGAAAGAILARFAQEPLAEYCSMWTSANATELFGYEALFLNLHPYQRLLKGCKVNLLNALEYKLVDAVCDVGVDINKAASYDHLSPMLAFVGGLGLRKADALRQNIRRSLGVVDSRNLLLIKKLLGKVVWTNASGFIRVCDTGQDKLLDPLDNTRIHPECYVTHDFAPKICADALEVDNSPTDYIDIVDKLMKSVRRDLEKRMKKHPKWLDLWEGGNRPIPGQTEYLEVIKTIDGEKHNLGIELNDSLSQLMLEDYASDLEQQGRGKRRRQLEHIKDELRFPWLDLRPSIKSISPTEMFTILTSETDYSLFVGLQVGCTVTDINDSSFYDERSGEYRRRQRANVATDSGLRGSIGIFDVSDDQIDSDRFNLNEHLQVGMHVMAVVVGVKKDRMQIDLSVKPSLLSHNEAWWMKNRTNSKQAQRWWEETCGKNPEKLFDRHFKESTALDLYSEADLAQKVKTEAVNQSMMASSLSNTHATNNNASGIKKKMRLIHHPLFANLDYKATEERLKSEGKGVGEVLIRPSSKGSDYLTITWAFQKEWFKHVSIHEKGKTPGDLGLGSELFIVEPDMKDEPFSDLDEIYSRYIDPMNDYVSAMVAHKSFLPGTPEDVVDAMKSQLKDRPNRIPYFIRYEENAPGFFVLTWMSVNANSPCPVKTDLITVRPSGYKIKGETFARASDLIVWFKEETQRALSQQKARQAIVEPRRKPSRFAPQAGAQSAGQRAVQAMEQTRQSRWG